MKIYLDVCCLNRPFDDQTQDRIRLETEAVYTILKFVDAGKFSLLNSDIIFYEVEKIPDLKRKNSIRMILSKARYYINLNEDILKRGHEIQKTGLRSYDALHIASAEYGKAAIFHTTDDRLLKVVKNHREEIHVKVENPLNWILEVLK